jgi:hypothetical protein
MEDIKANAMAELRKIPAGASSKRRIDGERERAREHTCVSSAEPPFG